jgi:hypothetical protein
MTPKIKPGEPLYIRPLKQIAKPGNIIVYLGKNGLIGHRITCFRQIQGTMMIVTQGDACEYPDEPIEAHQIIGQICLNDNAGANIYSLGNSLV